MLIMRNRVNLLVLGAAAALVLVGCGNTTPENATPASPKPGVTFVAPGDPGVVTDPPETLAPDDPAAQEPYSVPDPVPSGSVPVLPKPQQGEGLIDGMFVAINPSDVDVAGVQIDGFTSEQLQQAAAWAAAFTQSRYDNSGFWTDGDQKTDPYNPITYYPFLPLIEQKTLDKIAPWLLDMESVRANFAAITELVPLPPSKPGEWMLPAVGNYAFAQPTFTKGTAEKTVNVTVPYAAYAVAGEKTANNFYAIEIRDTATYTLALTKDGWRLTAWDSNPQYGNPEKLAKAPVDRVFLVQPTAP